MSTTRMHDSVTYVVWDQLSKQAQTDIMNANGPGSVIRCTHRDMDLIRTHPLVYALEQATLEQRVAALEQRMEDLEI